MDVRSPKESIEAAVEFACESGMSDLDLIDVLEQLATAAKGRLLAVKDGSPQIKPNRYVTPYSELEI